MISKIAIETEDCSSGYSGDDATPKVAGTRGNCFSISLSATVVKEKANCFTYSVHDKPCFFIKCEYEDDPGGGMIYDPKDPGFTFLEGVQPIGIHCFGRDVYITYIHYITEVTTETRIAKYTASIMPDGTIYIDYETSSYADGIHPNGGLNAGDNIHGGRYLNTTLYGFEFETITLSHINIHSPTVRYFNGEAYVSDFINTCATPTGPYPLTFDGSYVHTRRLGQNTVTGAVGLSAMYYALGYYPNSADIVVPEISEFGNDSVYPQVLPLLNYDRENDREFYQFIGTNARTTIGFCSDFGIDFGVEDQGCRIINRYTKTPQGFDSIEDKTVQPQETAVNGTRSTGKININMTGIGPTANTIYFLSNYIFGFLSYKTVYYIRIDAIPNEEIINGATFSTIDVTEYYDSGTQWDITLMETTFLVFHLDTEAVEPTKTSKITYLRTV